MHICAYNEKMLKNKNAGDKIHSTTKEQQIADEKMEEL